MPSTLISSGSKKKEPRYAWLSEEANASHSHRMWTEVSSSIPHFLQMGSLHNPMMCKCILKVLCPVSRPITTLDYVLLKDNNRAPIAGSGPEINSRACLCVLQRPRHNARCCLSIQRFIFLLIFCLNTQDRLRPNEPLTRTPCEPVGDFISSHSGVFSRPIHVCILPRKITLPPHPNGGGLGAGCRPTPGVRWSVVVTDLKTKC
jgi:hypothetical protein